MATRKIVAYKRKETSAKWLAPECFVSFIHYIRGNMYKIDIEPMDKPKDHSTKTKELLEVMMDVMENIEYIDDAGYVLRMKVMNNIEFLVDELMEEYQRNR